MTVAVQLNTFVKIQQTLHLKLVDFIGCNFNKDDEGREAEKERGREEMRKENGRKEINHLFSKSTITSGRIVSTNTSPHRVKHLIPVF